MEAETKAERALVMAMRKERDRATLVLLGWVTALLDLHVAFSSNILGGCDRNTRQANEQVYDDAKTVKVIVQPVPFSDAHAYKNPTVSTCLSNAPPKCFPPKYLHFCLNVSTGAA